MYRELSAPVSVQIELTSSCQLECVHCYNHWRTQSGICSTRLSQQQVVEVVKELLSHSVFQVVFTGGEPLLNKLALFAGLEYIRTNAPDVSVGINSNLCALTPADAEHLYRLGIKSVLTSFPCGDAEINDAITQRRGSHEDILNGIKVAQKAGISVACSMVASRISFEHIVSTARFLKQRGVTEFYATKCTPPCNCKEPETLMLTPAEMLRTMDDLVLLEKEGLTVGILECYPLCGYVSHDRYRFAAPRRCSAGITTCTIGSNGDVRPCSHSDVSTGNIFRDGIIKSWKQMASWRDGSLLPTECKECELFPACSGGCRIDAWVHSGSLSCMDPYANRENISSVELMPEAPSLPSDLKVSVPVLLSRAEGEAVLCSIPSRMNSPALVTADTFDLLQELQGKEFTIRELSDIMCLPTEEGAVICQAFLTDGLLQRVV